MADTEGFRGIAAPKFRSPGGIAGDTAQFVTGIIADTRKKKLEDEDDAFRKATLNFEKAGLKQEERQSIRADTLERDVANIRRETDIDVQTARNEQFDELNITNLEITDRDIAGRIEVAEINAASAAQGRAARVRDIRLSALEDRKNQFKEAFSAARLQVRDDPRFEAASEGLQTMSEFRLAELEQRYPGITANPPTVKSLIAERAGEILGLDPGSDALEEFGRINQDFSAALGEAANLDPTLFQMRTQSAVDSLFLSPIEQLPAPTQEFLNNQARQLLQTQEITMEDIQYAETSGIDLSTIAQQLELEQIQAEQGRVSQEAAQQQIALAAQIPPPPPSPTELSMQGILELNSATSASQALGIARRLLLGGEAASVDRDAILENVPEKFKALLRAALPNLLPTGTNR